MTTALADKIKALILASGPISVTDYFALCLADPEHGYYKTRNPFGRAGDFVTAPEISQLFGEMIGVFLVVAWQRHGEPLDARIVEIGGSHAQRDVLDLTMIEAAYRLGNGPLARALAAERVEAKHESPLAQLLARRVAA